MAANVSATYDLKLSVAETVAVGLDHAADPTTPHELTEHRATLNGTTTPAVTKVFSGTVTLTAGQASLDLTSLTGPSSTTVDFTGLKVQLVKLACPTTNTAGITVDAKDGTTGYNLFGANNANVISQSLNPQIRLASTNGAAIDLVNVETAYAIWNVGTIVDGTHTPTIEESDSAGSGFTTVGAGDLIGTLAALSSIEIQSVRYIGVKRYIRAAITITGGPATGGTYGAIIVGVTNKYNVLPGEGDESFKNDELEDVDSTHKDLIITGSGTETIEVLLVAG